MQPAASAKDALDKSVAFEGLTPKMEAYCIARIQGANQAEAYREAYNVDNCADVTIYHSASTLERHPKVVARLRELKAQRDEGLSLSPSITKAFVQNGIANLAVNSKSDSVKLRAFELLGKTSDLDMFRTTHVVVKQERTQEQIDSELQRLLAQARAGEPKTIGGHSTLRPAADEPPDDAPPDVRPAAQKRDRRRKPRA